MLKFFTNNKALCIIAIAIVAVYLVAKTSLGKTLSNIGGIFSDITGTAKSITGAVNRGVNAAIQFVGGSDPTSLAGYSVGAWNTMVSVASTNPFASAYVPVDGGKLNDNSAIVTGLVNEIFNSTFYVSEENVVSFFAAISNKDDVWDVINQLNAVSVNYITGYDSESYFTANFGQTYLDALAGNFNLKK